MNIGFISYPDEVNFGLPFKNAVKMILVFAASNLKQRKDCIKIQYSDWGVFFFFLKVKKESNYNLMHH